MSTLLGILSLLYKILSWWFLWVGFSETHAQCFFAWLDSFGLIAQTHPRCYTVFAEPAAAVAPEQWCHLHRASHSPQVAACVCFCEFCEAPALPRYSDFCRAWRGWRNRARLTNNPEEWPPRFQIKLYLSKTRGEMWVYLLCVLTLGLLWQISGLALKFGRSSKKVIDTLRLEFFFSLTHCNVLLFLFSKELLPPLGFTNYFQALFCLFLPWNSSDLSWHGKCALGEPERRFSWKIMAKPRMALTWHINPLNSPLFVFMLICGENDPAML